MPADILGQIYEQFLGKIIRLAGKRAIIEEKPEVRKAGGVYYTPTHVVRYIVQATLGHLLEGKTVAQIAGQDRRVREPVPLRIVDPACGSGSFLIEAYQYLLDWYRDRYVAEGAERHAKQKDPRLYQGGKSTGWSLTIAERRRILLTHIYGVDIDPQAVEVTKLSLLLKVLEGETADAIARQMDMFRVRALPDLVSNIRCGNSLIGPDFYKAHQIGLFDPEQQLKINVFDWQAEFPFLNKSGGFQLVIGNPPYLYSAGQEFATYFASRYKFSQYQTDYYVYFLETGLRLLREGGTLGFIIPDSWLNSDSFSNLRHRLMTEWRIEEICNFSFQVFSKVAIENTILIVSNKPVAKEIRVVTFTTPKKSKHTNTLAVEDITRIGIIDPSYSRAGEAIINHMDRFGKLGEVFELNRGLHAYRTDGYGQSAFGKGKQTKRDKEERSYHSMVRKNESYLPEIRGRDVFWFSYKNSGEFILYGKLARRTERTAIYGESENRMQENVR